MLNVKDFEESSLVKNHEVSLMVSCLLARDMKFSDDRPRNQLSVKPVQKVHFSIDACPFSP